MLQLMLNGEKLTWELVRAMSPIFVPECWIPLGFRQYKIMKECTDCPMKNTNPYFIKRRKNDKHII